jgi:teichuronic acid biosynthesis glycosyltransferase TuaG
MSLVSIILPYFKKKEFLEETINSILTQTYKNFEIILIDDEISLSSKDLLNKLSKKDERIKLIKNEKNIGAGPSRNIAIKHSQGNYIAFCDCDDLWLPKKLEIQLKFLKKNNIYFSHTSYDVIDGKNKFLSSRKAKSEINFKELRGSCDIGLSTVMVDRKVFDDETLKFAPLKTKEDFVLWLNIAKKEIKIVGLDEKLTQWRKIPNSLSSSSVQKLLDGYRVYRVYLGYSRFKSFMYLLLLSVNYILKR